YRFLTVFRPLMAADENGGVPVGSDREIEEHKQKVAAVKAQQESLQRKLDERTAGILDRIGKNPPAPTDKIYTKEVLAALRAEKRSGAQNKLISSLQKEIDDALARGATAEEKAEREKLQQRVTELARAKPPEITLAHIWQERPGPIPVTRILKRGDP